MYRKTELACIFLAGGTAYTLIEMMWRGYSHWSMTLAGGACMVIVHLIGRGIKRGGIVGFAEKCAACAACITIVEFTAGVILNLWLKIGVWDYSSMRWNVLGQICPAYTAAWFAVSAAALGVSRAADGFFEMIRRREITAQ